MNKTVISFMKKGLCPALMASALALSPSLATAQLSSTGPGAGVAGDISLGIQDTPILYSTLEVFVETAGVTLSTPGINNFSDGSWVDTDVSSTWSIGSGNPNNSLSWDVNFTDPVPNTFTFDLWTLDSLGNVLDSASATYNSDNPNNEGITFGDTVQSLSADQTANAPEPASIFLIGSGIVAVGFLRRRKRAEQ